MAGRVRRRLRSEVGAVDDDGWVAGAAAEAHARDRRLGRGRRDLRVARDTKRTPADQVHGAGDGERRGEGEPQQAGELGAVDRDAGRAWLAFPERLMEPEERRGRGRTFRLRQCPQLAPSRQAALEVLRED